MAPVNKTTITFISSFPSGILDVGSYFPRQREYKMSTHAVVSITSKTHGTQYYWFHFDGYTDQYNAHGVMGLIHSFGGGVVRDQMQWERHMNVRKAGNRSMRITTAEQCEDFKYEMARPTFMYDSKAGWRVLVEHKDGKGSSYRNLNNHVSNLKAA